MTGSNNTYSHQIAMYRCRVCNFEAEERSKWEVHLQSIGHIVAVPQGVLQKERLIDDDDLDLIEIQDDNNGEKNSDENTLEGEEKNVEEVIASNSDLNVATDVVKEDSATIKISKNGYFCTICPYETLHPCNFDEHCNGNTLFQILYNYFINTFINTFINREKA
jgi:hypothetical protein